MIEGRFPFSGFVRWMVNLCLIDRYPLAGLEFSVVSYHIPVPCSGVRTQYWLSNSRNAVRSKYSPSREHTTHELAIADCGTKISNPTKILHFKDCEMPCSGNAAEYCGGSNALILLNNDN